MMSAARNQLSKLSPLGRLGSVQRSRQLSSGAGTPLQIGIMRESYDKWERRTPLCPEHVKTFLERNPSCSVVVQPSPNRIFNNQEYERAGAKITDDLSDADLILAVKRPKTMDGLPGDKTYIFFSHVIKGQPENMKLLQDCLDKRIQLMDYECIVDSDSEGGPPKRLIAFGEYAGLAGMVDAFPALGKRLLMNTFSTPFLTCPPAIHHYDLTDVKRSVKLMAERIAADGLPRDLEPLVFAMTGKGGRVYSGVRELFDRLPHETVSVKDLPEIQNLTGSQHKVYCVAPEMDEMYERLDGREFQFSDYLDNPDAYRCVFADKIAPYSHVVMNCGYWDHKFPRLMTKDDIHNIYASGNDRMMVVADISCDVGGAIEFFERSTTIDRPAYQYDPIQGREVSDHIGDQGVTMLGVDILPTELPADSSRHFGSMLVDVMDEFASAKASSGFDVSKFTPKLTEATITTAEGELTNRFRYLAPILERRSKQGVTADVSKHMVMLLNGHLFDSGLINQVLDLIERYECSFEFKECYVTGQNNARGDAAKMKSSAVLKVTGSPEVDFVTVAKKISDLVAALETAEATVKVFDSDNKPAYVQDANEKTVLLLGSGLVSKSVVDLLGRSKDRTVVVASNDEHDARAIAGVARRGRHASLDVKNDERGLVDLVKNSDIVISLLPAPMHPQIAEICIKNKKDLVTASYESEAMRKLAPAAEQAGIIMLNEVGLDPGLDHMSAMRLIDDIHARGGTLTSFRSVCGGLPAPEAADNPLQYKFSWSPRGVISASQNSARYRAGNSIIEVDGKDLLASAAPFKDSWPDLDLECLPNRDSLDYEKTYGIENIDTLFRGTLRYDGFSSLMHVFKNMGFFDSHDVAAENWDGLLEEMKNRQASGTLDDFLLSCAGGRRELAMRAKECLEFLGMSGSAAFSNPGTVIDLFCNTLEDRLQYEKDEVDLVLMHHSIEATFEDGTKELHHSSLKMFGDNSMSAMCKTVGYPTAAATQLLMTSRPKKQGLLLPTTKDIYEPILDIVEKEGIVFDESVKVDTFRVA